MLWLVINASLCSVYLWVCPFVCQREPFEIPSRNLYGIKIWLTVWTSSKMAAFWCTGRSSSGVRTYNLDPTLQCVGGDMIVDPPLQCVGGDMIVDPPLQCVGGDMTSITFWCTVCAHYVRFMLFFWGMFANEYLFTVQSSIGNYGNNGSNSTATDKYCFMHIILI